MQQQPATGGADPTRLEIEPEAIQMWLRKFADTVVSIEQRAKKIRELAFISATAGRASKPPFANELSVKFRDRFGDADGGVADGYGQVVQQLKQLHEALRQALATHLGADFEAEDIMNLLGTETGE